MYSFATVRALSSGTEVFLILAGLLGVVLGTVRPCQMAAPSEAVLPFRERRLAEVVAAVSSLFILL